jgi:hypothetical protein
MSYDFPEYLSFSFREAKEEYDELGEALYKEDLTKQTRQEWRAARRSLERMFPEVRSQDEHYKLPRNLPFVFITRFSVADMGFIRYGGEGSRSSETRVLWSGDSGLHSALRKLERKGIIGPETDLRFERETVKYKDF